MISEQTLQVWKRIENEVRNECLRVGGLNEGEDLLSAVRLKFYAGGKGDRKDVHKAAWFAKRRLLREALRDLGIVLPRYCTERKGNYTRALRAAREEKGAPLSSAEICELKELYQPRICVHSYEYLVHEHGYDPADPNADTSNPSGVADDRIIEYFSHPAVSPLAKELARELLLGYEIKDLALRYGTSPQSVTRWIAREAVKLGPQEPRRALRRGVENMATEAWVC